MRYSLLACLLAVGTASTMAATGAQAATAQQQRDQKIAEIPRCGAKLGTIAVEQPQRNWWSELRLGSPEALIKVLVDRSGCFDLVDRGAGLAAAARERALASGGQLQQGSNIGGGQIAAADYVLIPDLLSQNARASGNRIGGALGGLLGGPVLGAIAGGLSFNSSTADVALTVTDVRSTRQLASIEGHGRKTDIGFGAGTGLFGGGGFGAGGATGYNNTEIGQVVMLAYVDAYSQLVDQLGGALPLEGASAANAQQSVIVNRPIAMYSQPSTRSTVVIPQLAPGTALFPTGNKNGLMWEVKDEKGNLGWVSSIAVDLAK
jgi:curli biogenesis system outer membrane secretion channel CsgG